MIVPKSGRVRKNLPQKVREFCHCMQEVETLESINPQKVSLLSPLVFKHGKDSTF